MIRKFITAGILSALLMTFSGCDKIDESIAVNAELEITVPVTNVSNNTYQPDTQTEIAAVNKNPGHTLLTNTPESVSESVSSAAYGTENGKVVESISLSTYRIEIKTGQSIMPVVTMLPADTPDKTEIWTSDDENIAVVDNLGNITGITEGNCIVRAAWAVNPDIYAEVEVIVINNPDTSGITYIDGILIANKTYPLPSDYNPGADSAAMSAFEEMREAAAQDGLNIYISSGYRSYEYQSGLYERYARNYGKEEADRFSARPGHSEHQTGLAFDLNSINDSFTETEECEWVALHAHEYGFIVRYPEGKEDITGYKYEPWHLRYLGKETASAVYESGLTLEEYLNISSSYPD